MPLSTVQIHVRVLWLEIQGRLDYENWQFPDRDLACGGQALDGCLALGENL